jgi:hypothetical protein
MFHPDGTLFWRILFCYLKIVVAYSSWKLYALYNLEVDKKYDKLLQFCLRLQHLLRPRVLLSLRRNARFPTSRSNLSPFLVFWCGRRKGGNQTRDPLIIRLYLIKVSSRIEELE